MEGYHFGRVFTDDSKVFTRIVAEKNIKKHMHDNRIGNEVLQRDLDNMKMWAEKWKMEFNVGKCKVMHLGRLNQCQSYTMGGENLEVTTEERDLGVLFDNKLDFGNHITIIRAITNIRQIECWE